MLIEQAIFASAQTGRADGYQVVAASGGIGPDDLRELAVWGPSHDALLDDGAAAGSCNFHPLPSSAYCVSKSVAAGGEYSDRGGRNVYTQCLVVPGDVLARFANNPLAILRAVQASGNLQVQDKPPRELPTIRLVGRAAIVDRQLLARLAIDPGCERLAALVGAALAGVVLGVCGGPKAELLFEGILNCLPPGWRTEFSFASGLKFSPRRPFRMIALPDDQTVQRRLERQFRVTIVDLRDAATLPTPRSGWGGYLAEVLRAGKVATLAAHLETPAANQVLGNLDALGDRLRGELSASIVSSSGPSSRVSKDQTVSDAPAAARLPATLPAGTTVRADVGESRPSEPSSSFAVQRPATTTLPPSRNLHPGSRRALEQLEQLDAAVHEAIGGSESAMTQVKSLWPQVISDVPAEMVEESREQYLRYALSIWGECLDSEVRDPRRAASALDVLCLLFDE